jgi:hypothetical protein
MDAQGRGVSGLSHKKLLAAGNRISCDDETRLPQIARKIQGFPEEEELRGITASGH